MGERQEGLDDIRRRENYNLFINAITYSRIYLHEAYGVKNLPETSIVICPNNISFGLVPGGYNIFGKLSQKIPTEKDVYFRGPTNFESFATLSQDLLNGGHMNRGASIYVVDREIWQEIELEGKMKTLAYLDDIRLMTFTVDNFLICFLVCDVPTVKSMSIPEAFR